MGKEISTFCDTELKIINFTVIKINFLKNDVDIDKILIFNRPFSGEKVQNRKRKHIQKVMMAKLNGCIFRLKMMNY